MSTRQPWGQVQAEIRGRRLAVYSDLGEGVAVNVNDPNVQNALGWLAYHQLLVKDDVAPSGLRVRTFAEARARWEAAGAAEDAAAAVANARSVPVEKPKEPERRPVHTHQAQLFA